MQYGCLKLIQFSEKSGRLSSAGSEILAFGSHCSANFQTILDCFVPKFKLKYDDLENIKTDRLNTVVFNLLQIELSKFILGHPVHILFGVSKFETPVDIVTHILISDASICQ